MDDQYGCKEIGVPKIEFLWRQLIAREQALESRAEVFYVKEDGTLVAEPGPRIIELKGVDLEKDIYKIREFLEGINKPVNSSSHGSHCCALGKIFLRC